MKTDAYTTQTFELIAELSDYRMKLDILKEADNVIVLDIFGIGELNLDAWAYTLKNTATAGAIYAYDHRIDGPIDEGLPSISILFESLHGTDGVAALEKLAADNKLVSSLIDDLRLRLVVEEDANINFSQSSRLLQVAQAF